MKERNGFALSATIYSLFMVMVLIIFYILYIVTASRTSVGLITKSVEAEINTSPVNNCNTQLCNNAEDTLFNKLDYCNTINTIFPNENEEGLFIDTDNNGSSMYFRGNVANNYVKFGKDNERNDLIWRIVRINGDKTVRLVLDDIVKIYSIDTVTDDQFEIVPGTIISYIDSDDQEYCGYDFVNYTGICTPTKDGDNSITITTGRGDANNKYLNNNKFCVTYDDNTNSLYDTFRDVSNNNNIPYYANSLKYWFENVSNLFTSNMLNMISNENTFCKNNTYTASGTGTRRTFVYPTNFSCSDSNSLVNSYVGLLSYNEVQKAKADGYLNENIISPYILSSYSEKSENDEYYYLYLYSVSKGAIEKSKYFERYSHVSGGRYGEELFFKDSDDECERQKSATFISSYKYYRFPGYLRPVINLKSDIKFKGNGTENTPYEVVQ